MKLEFLADGSPDCPLIRLFDFRTSEVEDLRRACADLADGRRTEFRLHDQPWIEAIRGCQFIWRASTKDVGVRLPPRDQPFVLEFSDEAWREVQDKLQEFGDFAGSYNWLTNEGEVNVLFSRLGDW